MIWVAPTDQSRAFETAGHKRRMPMDFDRLNLVWSFPPRVPANR